MTSQIIGQFLDDAALFGDGADGIDVYEPDVVRIVSDHGATIRPLHPGATDAALRRYFVVDVGPDGSAAALAERLRTVPAVDGAWVKTAEEAPDAPP